MIHAEHLTKRFPNGKGIFDVGFDVGEGEVLGFIGPNGAGKSTTIRSLMGFLKPDGGNAEIAGYSCWREAERVKSKIGYLPGEIVFPSGMSARHFLNLQAEIRNIRDQSRMESLIDRFCLNTGIPIKSMSKGMKQKLAIVSAFMGDAEVILLDEPSTGLDPLMQKEFIALLREEKGRGKTIFLSSHIFTEIENVADAICFIKSGKIVEYEKFSEIHKRLKPLLLVTLRHAGEAEKLHIPFTVLGQNKVGIEIDHNENEMLRQLSQCDVENIDVKKTTLDDIFEKYYAEEV